MKKRSSKKTSLEIGDRFRSKYNIDYIIEWLGSDWLCIDNTVGPLYTDKGSIIKGDEITFKRRDFTYLGNFAKSNKFEELYNIMNDTK